MSKKKDSGAGPFEALRPIRDELQRKEQTTARKPGAAPVPRDAPERTPSATTPQSAKKEEIVFHRLFAGVTPLSRPPGRIAKQRLERPAAGEHPATRSEKEALGEGEAVRERIRQLVHDRVRFEVSDDGRRVEGRRIDVPVDVVRKLRRGMIPIDARVDLHGMRLQEARTHLDLFLRTMRARGERCVLVIHGKGEHSASGFGVLRGEISAWLSQGRSSEHTSAFATARGEDGGEGAVYVLLRR